MTKNNSITVIHLVWLPYGTGLFKQFIDSYLQFDAGCTHTLMLVFNGVSNEADTDLYHAYIKAAGIAYTSINIEKGQDLSCYFEAAGKTITEYIMILNSFSVLLAPRWLKKYLNGFSDPATGLIGATGSCQSYYSSVYQKHPAGWEGSKNFLYNFRKYKLFIKAFFYWRFLFRPFPSPHLRTNAFMIKRSLFLNLKHKPFLSKFAAYQFESGRKSMTSQIVERGHQVLVIDCYGKTYAPEEWKNSATFWISNQENLLVADNQTRIYMDATGEEKKEMTRLAWGTT